MRGGNLWKYAVDRGIHDGLTVTMATALRQLRQLYREQKEDAVVDLQALQYNNRVSYSRSKRNPLRFIEIVTTYII